MTLELRDRFSPIFWNDHFKRGFSLLVAAEKSHGAAVDFCALSVCGTHT
jgi:hypothetical protein